jgi:hypothetical protein
MNHWPIVAGHGRQLSYEIILHLDRSQLAHSSKSHLLAAYPKAASGNETCS